MVPVPDGRRRVRRGRLPRDRPELRHAGRGRGATSRRRTRWGSAPSSTSCRTTARTSRTGSSRRWRPGPGRPSGSGSCSAPGRGGRPAAERLAVDLQRTGLDPGAGRRSGTCTCSRRSSRTSTGAIPRWSRSSTTSCGSGWTAASTGSGSTVRPCCSRTWTVSRSRTPITTRCTRCTAAGGRSPTRTRAASWSARCGCRTRNGSRCTCGRTRCRPRSTSTSCPGPWDAAELRASIDLTLTTHVPIGAPPTWVLSNHDVTRPVTKYGRPDTSFSHQDRKHGMPTDPVLGERRARAAALLAMALPGGLYVYQGEELGLPEVEDLPDALLQDPICGLAPAAPTAAATAAASRSRGPAKNRRSASAPVRRGSRSRPTGRTSPSSPSQADQNSMLALYRNGLPSAEPTWATAP